MLLLGNWRFQISRSVWRTASLTEVFHSHYQPHQLKAETVHEQRTRPLPFRSFPMNHFQLSYYSTPLSLMQLKNISTFLGYVIPVVYAKLIAGKEQSITQLSCVIDCSFPAIKHQYVIQVSIVNRMTSEFEEGEHKYVKWVDVTSFFKDTKWCFSRTNNSIRSTNFT